MRLPLPAVDAASALDRIGPYVLRTPLEPSPHLSEATGARVHLKLENLQRTGSFKLRGAMNLFLSLVPREREAGIVAASTGNHGLAVAWGAAELAIPAVIFAPETATPSKLEAIRAHGVEVRSVGRDCVDAERAARDFARNRGRVYVSPYNDPRVIAGQATLGVELAEELAGLQTVVLSVGGGGLACGVGGYLKAVLPGVRVLAASPRNSAVMHASLAAGRILDLPSLPTLSDGTAGGVEEGSITFEGCREVIDDFVLVSEEAIADGMHRVKEHHGMLVEGAAGVAVAACLAHHRELAGREVAVVLCGGNVDQLPSVGGRAGRE